MKEKDYFKYANQYSLIEHQTIPGIEIEAKNLK